MSTNYQESAVTGTKWKRCVRLVCGNPYGGTPVVSFEEEEAVNVGDKTLTFPIRDVFIKPFSAAGSFALLNPLTGIPTGQTMTHAELIGVLYSLYIACATERDNP